MVDRASEASQIKFDQDSKFTELSPIQEEGLGKRVSPVGKFGQWRLGRQFKAVRHFEEKELDGPGMPFVSEGKTVNVLDPAYNGSIRIGQYGNTASLSSQAELSSMFLKNKGGVALDYNAAATGTDGRPLIKSAEITEADGSKYSLQRLGSREFWKDSRTGKFRALHIERNLGDDPASTSEVVVHDLSDSKQNLAFTAHGGEPKALATHLSTADLLERADADKSLSHYIGRGVSSSFSELRNDFKAFSTRNFGDLLNLTSTNHESLLQKYEELGRYALKEHGGKIAIGISAAMGLAIAGEYLLGSHEKQLEK